MDHESIMLNEISQMEEDKLPFIHMWDTKQKITN